MIKISEQWIPCKQQGDKFCTQCKSLCHSDGGGQLVTADRLHQRWICKKCKDRQDEALQKKLATP